MKKQEIQKLEKKAVILRKKILSMITKANASHIGSAYSCLELLIFLYSYVLKIYPKNPFNKNRDRFILSKGWAISALFAVLADKKIISQKDLENYCLDGSKLIGCATYNGIAGIEATTGSMGHGLPIGVGMALAAKIQNKKYKIVVLISDGECDEGSTWEAILQAGHHKLNNLVVIIDYNKLQSFGKVKDILDLEPLSAKWKAFKWNVLETNGNSFKDLSKTFKKITFKNKPTVIIAHTTKGKGVSIFENRNEWHYKTPKSKELEIAEKELII